tara:strand:- start:906 stop:1529 length:624 start_codon:yes stop_codon:yes gene_type:complete
MMVRHFFAVLFLSLAIYGCAAISKEEKNYTKNGLTISFRSINYLNDVQNIKFIYPIILSEKNIRNHLLSLYYQDIIRPRKPRPVFSRDAVEEMAPLLKTVFRKVKPRKYLHFEYQTREGVTEGQVFATNKKLYWDIFRINGIAYSNNPLRIVKPTWKLVRAPRQKYQTLYTGTLETVVKNRIIANIKMPFPKQRFQSQPKNHSSSRY